MTATTNSHLALSLPDDDLAATAGGHANVRLTLHNRSSHVDRVWLAVEGAPAGWAELHPDSLSLPPRRAGVAWLVVQPPVGAAGDVRHVSIRVRSAIDATVDMAHHLDVRVATVAAAA